MTQNSVNLRKELVKSRLVTVPKGEVIHRSDNGLKFFMIASGYIKRYLVTNEGTLSIQGIYGPGYIFPLTSIYKLVLDQKLYRGPEIYYYETLCPSKIHFIEEEEFRQIIERNPNLYRDLFAVAGSRLRSNIQEIENMSLRNAYARVAHQLLYFSRTFGVSNGETVQIPVPLTHETLAAVLNLARETVSQSISHLREEKLIKTNKYIMVLDSERLEQVAYA